jgi:hypothetical protein
MAQLDDLNAGISKISDDISAISGDVSSVLAELKKLQGTTPPPYQPIDLSGPIASLTALDAKLQGIDASLKTAEVVADPAPTPEPAPAAEPTLTETPAV